MRILVSGSTKTVSRIRATHPDRLGILLTPANGNSIASVTATGLPWAIDNGAFSGFKAPAFVRLLDKAQGQPRLLWVAAPDVVGDAVGTMAMFDEWQPEIARRGMPVALVGQDGIEQMTVPWGRIDAVFLGGSTEWKLSLHAEQLSKEAKRRGLLVHMGRVNTLRRLRIAKRFGCDTVDGSAASKWGDDRLTEMVRWVGKVKRERELSFK